MPKRPAEETDRPCRPRRPTSTHHRRFVDRRGRKPDRVHRRAEPEADQRFQRSRPRSTASSGAFKTTDLDPGDDLLLPGAGEERFHPVVAAPSIVHATTLPRASSAPTRTATPRPTATRTPVPTTTPVAPTRTATTVPGATRTATPVPTVTPAPRPPIQTATPPRVRLRPARRRRRGLSPPHRPRRPLDPILVGFLPGVGSAEDVSLVGTMAFARLGSVRPLGRRRERAEHPGHPGYRSSIRSRALRSAARGNRAVVTGVENGLAHLWVLDVSGSPPETLGEMATTGHVDPRRGDEPTPGRWR